MENTDLLKSQLEIDDTAASHFLEMAKWAKFIAIIGFVFCGIMVLYGIFASFLMSYFFQALIPTRDSAAFGGFFAVVVIIFALLTFIPCYFLFKFAVKIKAGIHSSDQLTVNESLNLHRRYYKFVGICTIIILSFYVLVFILAIVGNLARSSF